MSADPGVVSERSRRFGPLKEGVKTLLLVGSAAFVLSVAAFLTDFRLGANQFPIWVYLVAMGGIAIVGAAASTFATEPLDDMPRAGARIGGDLIVVPLAAWEALVTRPRGMPALPSPA